MNDTTNIVAGVDLGKYKGATDFMLNASEEDKLKVFSEVARLAGQDRQKVLEQAGMRPDSH